MSDIVELLRQEGDPEDWWERMQQAADEIERLRADKAAISQTASDYLHDLERLRKAVRDQAGVELSEENDRLIDEIKLLRASLELLQRWTDGRKYEHT